MSETLQQTILVVDDTPANIDLLRKILQSRYNVCVASNGECALELAHADPRPDLILLDIMMPKMDGYEVCRRLKADEATAAIPVIFVTAKSEVEDEAAGFRLGAVDYITKPLSLPIVLARVSTHLALSQARNTLEERTLELRETARLKEDVENITRHDLKTPLTCIIGMPSLIASSGNLTPDQQEFLAIIEESGYRMLQMVNSSLDLYKMEKKSYRFTPDAVNACAVTYKVLRELQDLLHAHRCAARVELDAQPAMPDTTLSIWAEELLTYSLLANLVKNAIEASPEESEITIALTTGVQPQIAIHNFGAVPEVLRETFFEKYATAGKKGGTGLGTYSAKLITDTQGGSIAMQTSLDEGTTITVTFLPPPA
ncbi:MAG TPA: hybrid sensor histidine kinase/response regulator [Armatimonadota bacterium]